MDAFEDTLRRILTTRVAGCRDLLTLERLSGGASQETYALSIDTADGPSRLCLRRAAGGSLAEDAHGRPGLAVEARLISLARAAGVPEPEILYVLQPYDGLGEGFVMTWVSGETLGARITRHADFAAVRPRLARQCGEILARIHAIEIGANGLDRALATIEPEQFIRRQWQQYQDYGTAQPMIDYTARWLLENLPPAQPLTLVHNDFRNGNLIVNPADGVSAVLDWELAHIGDPMRDFGWICTNSWRFGVSELEVGGFGSLDDLIAGYESAGGRSVDRSAVRFWTVFGSFWWAIGCLSMANQYRTGPDRTVERPGIGRRSSECQVDCVNLIMPGPITLPSPTPDLDDNLPRSDELLDSVKKFLREDISAATDGRLRFMARVAANSLDILARERVLGPATAAAEQARLAGLLGGAGELEALRRRLVEALRDGSLALDYPGLCAHLRNSVVAQVAIDQPVYSGFKTALDAAALRNETPHD